MYNQHNADRSMPTATTQPDKEQSAFTCITDEHGNRKTEEGQETTVSSF